MAVAFCQVDSPKPSLCQGETHVYVEANGDSDKLSQFLTEDELSRAARYRLGGPRNQFVAARGRLRSLLGQYLDMSPRAVPLQYADEGKPHLPSRYALHFNVSHTDGLAVFALSNTRVGVDVERDRQVADAQALVKRFFSRREFDEFQNLPAAIRQSAFLRAWTCKEALLKAMGRGVRSLEACEVTIGLSPPTPRCIDGSEEAAASWELQSWEPAKGYLAAVAVEK